MGPEVAATVVGWNDRSALAFVDGVRVRVRRKRDACRWSCATHGARDFPHCPHLEELAATPADPALRSRHVR